jgi:hypothetical protein
MLACSSAAMMLLAALTGCGGNSAGSPTVSSSPAGPGTSASVAGVEPDDAAIGADGFDVKMVDPGVGDLQLPLRQTQHGELDRLGFVAEWEPDAFDFDERLAVSFNIPSGSCIPVLAGFDSDAGRTVRPRFAPHADLSTCDEQEQWPLYLVTIDRSAVAPWFVLELPGSDRPGHTMRRLRIDIEPTPAERHGLQPVHWEVLASSRVTVPRALATDAAAFADLWARFGSSTLPPRSTSTPRHVHDAEGVGRVGAAQPPPDTVALNS